MLDFHFYYKIINCNTYFNIIVYSNTDTEEELVEAFKAVAKHKHVINYL